MITIEERLRLAEEALIKNGFTKLDDVWIPSTSDDALYAAMYRWLAWTSDTNSILIYDPKNDRIYFGDECDEAIKAAMKEKP